MNQFEPSPIDQAIQKEMLLGSGYSEKAINFFLNKTYMGSLKDPDHVTEMIGSCGDTMKVFLKIHDNIIDDIRYQVLGCPGAISSAMAAAHLVKGKSLDDAKKIDDKDVFKELEEIPSTKHHCIQLAVKTLHKAIDEYKNGHKKKS